MKLQKTARAEKDTESKLEAYDVLHKNLSMYLYIRILVD